MLAGAATVALAAGALATIPALADPIPVATSYADLLEPVPNAMERLAVADANPPAAHLELAQYGGPNYHHHHHHHHHHFRDRRWYLSNGYYWAGGGWRLRPVHHHHHHHHHHHYGY
jgi:hypothetical protein